MSRFGLVLPAFLLFVPVLPAQQQPTTPTTQKPPTYDAMPVEAAKQPNPVKHTPESLTRAKKWWNLDCAMCHSKEGDTKGETARDMKLNIVDFTNPATLKDRTSHRRRTLLHHQERPSPPEGPRIKTEEGWDLVNYVRSFSKKKTDTDQKPQ